MPLSTEVENWFFEPSDTSPALVVLLVGWDSMGFEQRRAAQETLHWQTAASFDGRDVILSITDRSGKTVYVNDLSAVVGLATREGQDRPVDLLFGGSDYRAAMDLPAGNWQLRLAATAQDGTSFRQILPLIVRGK